MIKNTIRVLAGLAMLAALAVTNTAFATGCTTNDDNAPCFANNDDILAGTRNLLPVDDLHVSLPFIDTDGKHKTRLNFLKTELLAVESSTIFQTQANCSPSFQAKLQSVTGRLFATPNDMLVNIRMNIDCSNLSLNIIDQVDSNNNSSRTLYSAGNVSTSLGYAGMVTADFNQDGYDDIFTILDGEVQVFTALCTSDPFNDCTQSPSQGLYPGPARALGRTGPYAGAPVAGDFDGDGYMDVAIPVFTNDSREIMIEIASVCPAAGVVIRGFTCPAALQIQSFRLINLGAILNRNSKKLSRPTLDIGAGNFDGLVDPDTGIADDELVVALADSDNSFVTVTVYDYDANTDAMVAKASTEPFDIENNDDNAAQVFIEGAQLDSESLQYQAVFSWTKKGGSIDHRGVVSVISFDNTLGMTVKSTSLSNNSKTRIYGMAVGRFDPPDVGGAINFNNQIAILISHADSDTQIQFFRALSSTTFTPAEVTGSRINIDDDLYLKDSMQLAALTAGDLQGRSLVLGAPDIITVSTTQADVIIGLPPMHVDFIEPVNGGEPQVVNISVFPETFNAGFDFDVDSGTTSSHEGTTGYSGAWKESVEFTQKYGTSGNGVTAKFKVSADQEYERTVTKSHDTYSGQSYSLVAKTLFDDLIIGTSTRSNIYSYPVIGQGVCPDTSTSCDPSCIFGEAGCEKEQLMLQYTGPDNIIYTSPAQAGGMEWYQPVTEPGNIFSYPGSLALLKINESMNGAGSDINLLTSPNNVWDSQEPEEVEVQWNDGGGKSRSIDISKQFSLGIGGSLKSTESIKAVESSSVKIKLDTEQSVSFGNINTVGHEWNETTGVTLERGLGPSGNASDNNLLYQGATFIYGLNASSGTIAPALGTPTTDTHISTYGPFKVGHVANVLSTSLPTSGGWWKQAYTVAPDLGLNHPQRWLQKLPEGSVPPQVKFNCPIGFESDLEEPEDDPGSCVVNEDEPNTSNLALAEFYKMKGLFVTSADSDTGPTLSLATLGAVMKLQARVYNFSLKNMPNGSTAHVRFYAQPWDASTGRFTSGSGQYGFANATFIGEDVLASPIPAYCGGSQGFDSCSTETTPNYVMATVQWDTGTLSPQPNVDTDWKFWVVVWMEDSNGDLLEEIESHGLTEIPALRVASLAEILVEPYSNNIGFYNQTFSLFLPVNNPPGALNSISTERELVIEKIETEPELLKKHALSAVRVHYRASGDHYESVNVLLYEGDSEDGELLDMDLIPRMQKEQATVVTFPYRPKTCGAHSLFVQTFQSDGNDPLTETISFDVPCEPLAITKFKGKTKVSGKHGNDHDNGHGNKHGNKHGKHDKPAWYAKLLKYFKLGDYSEHGESKGKGKNDKDSVQLSGQFELKRANSLAGIDLATSAGQVTLHSLLEEIGGNGELVEEIPVVLYAGYRNTEKSAVYETEAGVTPVVTLTVKKRKKHPGSYSFKLKVKKANINPAETCPKPELLTSFTIDDGGSMPVHVVTDAGWKCKGKSGNMKTR